MRWFRGMVARSSGHLPGRRRILARRPGGADRAGQYSRTVPLVVRVVPLCSVNDGLRQHARRRALGVAARIVIWPRPIRLLHSDPIRRTVFRPAIWRSVPSSYFEAETAWLAKCCRWLPALRTSV